MRDCETKPQTESLQIRLFGTFEVRVQEQPLPPIHSRKGHWLLALLTLRHGRETPRDWLAGTLWPDTEESQGLFYLRKTLSELRRALGAEGARLLAPTPRTLALNLNGAFADVLIFDALAAREEAASLEQAVAQYRGPLLEGCPEEWVLPERMARQQTYLNALEKLATLALARADYAAAIRHLRLTLSSDPLIESAHRALMQALSADGNPAAALEVYRELRVLLHNELNVEPAPETTALFQQIRSETRQTVTDSAKTSLSVASRSSPATPSAPYVSRLPRPLTALIGREEETQEIEERVLSARLVTLTGTGGIGKTRLAIRVAECLEERWPNHAWFVDLAALSDADLVPQAVAHALEVREQPGQPLMETILEALRGRVTRFRAPLLILDNCEHLLDACARLVTCLLDGCAPLHILATSRQSLGVTGEVVWRVNSLSLPPAALLEAEAEEGVPLATYVGRKEKDQVAYLLDYAAVRLFVERASSARHDFRFMARNAMTVARICQRLDGIPLAIELAAARIRALSEEDIAARLERRFQLLTGGDRTRMPRQQTLRAALDWSYNLLTEPEQTLLQRLSLFAGGWTLEAAERVCAGEGLEDGEVLDVLASLVDKSLVLFAEQEEAGGRYFQLETVRQYGWEQLRQTESWAAWRNRHRDYFLQYVQDAERKRLGPEQQVWLQQLETEHDNLRAALNWCEEAADGAESGLEFVGLLWRFWNVRGYLAEGRRHLTKALERPGTNMRTRERAKALNGAGELARYQCDYDQARLYYEESLAIWRELNDAHRIADGLTNLGNIANEQGDYAAAHRLYEESLTFYQQGGNRHGRAYALSNLGAMACSQGEYALARSLLEESLAIMQELGDKQGIAIALHSLGLTTSEQGNYIPARSLLEQSLTIYQELGDKQHIAYCLSNLGIIASELECPLSARPLQEESLAIMQELGDKRGVAYTLCVLGGIACDQGDYASARSLIEEGLSLQQALSNKHGQADALAHLGRVAYKQGDHAAAHACFRASLTLSQELENTQGVWETLKEFAQVAWAQKQAARAARLGGAIEALQQSLSIALPPRERKELEGNRAAVQEALEAGAFAAAWEAGRTMTLEQAVQYALEQTDGK
jgi:predicted ATPase/DNA-binding SARP family transcriptional activator/uncharacterized protein HemY